MIYCAFTVKGEILPVVVEADDENEAFRRIQHALIGNIARNLEFEQMYCRWAHELGMFELPPLVNITHMSEQELHDYVKQYVEERKRTVPPHILNEVYT